MKRKSEKIHVYTYNYAHELDKIAACIHTCRTKITEANSSYTPYDHA